MRTSATTAQIDAAMARVQAKLEVVERNKKVEIEGKEGKKGWDSKYVTLDRLYKIAKPLLAAEGITWYQGGGYIQGGGERLYTRLAFCGEWIECDFPVKAGGDMAQKYGGGMSFARRWGLCCMVGLVADVDDDERAGYQDNRPTRPQRAKSAPGLPERLASITSAGTTAELARRAIEARSAHAVGEDATSVEKAISAWVVHALHIIAEPDELTEFKDLITKVKPRGADVHAAMQAAERRILPDVKS